MIKKLIFVLALLFNLNFYAQVNFEKGYFINNNNSRTECFIRNQGWRNNPTKFDYKTSENEKASEKGISEVKEFGVGEFDIFERFDVLVDHSEVNVSDLSTKKEPEWVKKTIFLKAIIQGNARLYKYVDGNAVRFFYSYKGSPVEQLVYKKYLEDSGIKENNFFQQQLFTKVKCESIILSDIFKIKYTEEDLSKYFLTVNNCGVDVKDVLEKKTNEKVSEDRRDKSRKDNFLIRAKAGVGFNSFAVNYTTESTSLHDFKFDGDQTYKLGLDAEYVLPTNKNKWSVFFDADYQSKYESQKNAVVGVYPNTYERKWNISYSCLNLGLGIRYYMFLNNNSKLFLNVLAIYSPQLEGKLENDDNEKLDLKSRPHFGVGFGYSYKRYNIEGRLSNRSILDDYYYISSKYKDFSIVLGYTLFESNKKK